jgi:hypothetical protein
LTTIAPSHANSRSYAAFQGCRERRLGSCSAITTIRRRMKSSWIGIGFSHQSVPSLSNTAIRCSGSTALDSTNLTIASVVAVSFQDASASLIISPLA